MPTNVKLIPPGYSQASTRGVVFWYDQHKDPHYTNADGKRIFEMGRPYWSFVERPASGTASPMPVGEVIPMGWSAPFYVPQKYIVRSIGRVQSSGDWLTGAGSTQFFRIDYTAMLKDDKTATDNYYALAVQEAVRLKEPMPRYGQPLSPELRLVLGRPPRSPKIAEACMAGDKWILGQQMPIWDADLRRHVIPPNKPLMRLLQQMHETVLTPDEVEELEEREANRTDDLMALVQKQAEMLEALYADMERIKAEKAAPKKRGRPKKETVPPTDE